jgi:hypothetical protein
MFEGPVIIWAASRGPTAAETRIISHTARAVRAGVRTVAMSSLASEIVSSIVRGAVIVIVDSRKDAAAALGFGADETVRLETAVPASDSETVGGRRKPAAAIRRSALRSAIDRAIDRSAARVRRVATPEAVGDYPGLALLMRVVERQLGSPLNEAALNCNRLADELAQAVAVADGLMQRVRLGSSREEIKEWSREVKQYAQATLRAETLVSELRGQVERGDAVMKLLGDSSAESGSTRTDTESLLHQLAELLRVDLGSDVSIDLLTAGPCFVEMARPALLCIVCAATEIALDNIRSTSGAGLLEFRTSKTDTEVLIEVADDGGPGVTDLRPSFIDLLGDPRTAKLRQLRERVRGADGELTVDSVDGGTVVSIYLPLSPETAVADPISEVRRFQFERRHH